MNRDVDSSPEKHAAGIASLHWPTKLSAAIPLQHDWTNQAALVGQECGMDQASLFWHLLARRASSWINRRGVMVRWSARTVLIDVVTMLESEYT